MRITITTTGDTTVTTIDVDEETGVAIDGEPISGDAASEHIADGFLPPLDAKETHR